jgi:hypothetical protein
MSTLLIGASCELEPRHKREPGSKLIVISVVSSSLRSIVRRGGARRDRTDDLMLAKHALSQLSYGPVSLPSCEARRGGPGTS